MAKKIKKQCSGGILDLSVNTISISSLWLRSNDMESFTEEFGLLIGRYRMTKEVNDSEPMPKETVNHLRKIISQVATLKENIDLLPLDAQAWCDEAIYLRSKKIPEFSNLYQHNFPTLLDYYSSVINHAIYKVEQYPDKKGRSKNVELQNFIYDTYLCFDKYLSISIKKNELYSCIGNLLIQNGINVPTEAENIGKIINKVKRSRNGTSEV